MSIRNWDAFKRNFWDWNILQGCFGGKIEPTDLDGIIERHGRFLVLETKAPGKDIPEGQFLMFRHMAATGRFTILFIWGEPGVPEKIWGLGAGDLYKWEPADLSDLREICAKWYAKANADPIKSLPPLRITHKRGSCTDKV